MTEREKVLLDNIVKNAYSNFSSIYRYILNEKKREEEKEKDEEPLWKRSSITRVIRLPLTRTSRLSCPNELSSTTSYNGIKKQNSADHLYFYRENDQILL